MSCTGYCVCHTPFSSATACECCQGRNSVAAFHGLRFEILCRLYGRREDIGQFTDKELESVNDLMRMVEEYGSYCEKEAYVRPERA